MIDDLMHDFDGVENHTENYPVPGRREDYMPDRLARYECLVHPRNRSIDDGIPVSVLAANRREAVARAMEVGWSGRPEDGRVTVLSIADEPVR
jgi:hypothetical protein